MRNTILFDLDGTLLPMDQNTFIHAYFSRLAMRFVPLGYDKDTIIGGVWKGTKAMIANDGTMTNRERFWRTFEQLLDRPLGDFEAQCDDFYTKEFREVQAITKESDVAARVLPILREKGYLVALATNPVFPAVAVRTRLSWIGLSPEDFDYVTTYENSRFCKPNPRYFEDVMAALGVTAEDCYMVGNNTEDDLSAAGLGVEMFMVTDFLENETNVDITGVPHGTLEELLTWAENLPAVK